MSDGWVRPIAARLTSTRHVLGALVAVGAVAMTVFVAVPALVQRADAANAATIVDSTADDPDLTAADGVCLTAANECTLRAAIKHANVTPGHDVIEFGIPGPGPHRIEPATPLPVLKDETGVTIDGYSQDGAQVNDLDHGTNAVIQIELKGPGYAGPDGDPVVGDENPEIGFDGLFLRSPDNVITGLAIFDFGRHIRIYGDDPTTTVDNEPDPELGRELEKANDNTIVGNFIGTDATGAFAANSRAIGADGVHLQHGVVGNRIGMPGNENRNVISGAADRGIGLFNPGTERNTIQNNIIGLAPGADGATPLPNQNHGVDINLGASHNTVGGWSAGEGNVVSSNGRTGVEVSHNATTVVTERNQVVGNLIGTNAAGTDATAATANGEYGIYFEGHAVCPEPGISPPQCTPDIRLNVAAGNVVVGSRSNVVLSKGAHENSVVDNWIGVLQDGSAPSSIATTIQQGVSIEMGAFDNRIDGNTIANSLRGIHATPKDSRCPAIDQPNGPECRAAEFPVFGNTFTRNSIVGTPLLGIELRSKGSSLYEDGPGVTAAVNGGIEAPTLVAGGVTTDEVVVATCGGCRVEVFEAVPPPPGSSWPAYGRADRFVTAGTANGAGRAVIDVEALLLVGAEVTATATDALGNTSELSLRAEVESGDDPPPSSTSTTTTSVPVGFVVDGFSSVSDAAVRCRQSTKC